MKTHEEISAAIDKYADTVRRICCLYMKNEYDSEDVFQNVFMKYCSKSPVFADDEHEKAWIIRVTINECKDGLKSFFRKNTCSIELVKEQAIEEKDDLSYVREAVCRLPENYRNAVYLCYYEGYSAVETAKMLHKNTNTVYTWINRAKAMLKDMLGGEEFE